VLQNCNTSCYKT